MTHPLNVVDLDLASEWHTRSHAAAWPSPSDYAGGSSEDLAVTNGKTNYTDFDGDTIRMKIWMGEHIAILTPAGISPDGSVMHNLVKAFDGGFSYYESITGRDPTPYDPTTINGRDTIAIVPDTLGNAASTYVGFNGSEIAAAYFGGPFGTPVQSFPTYNAMSEHGTVNSLMFYEFGRSFWFYGDQLGDYGFVTGFAYINREFAIMKAGFPIDPGDIGGGTNRDLPAIAQTFFRDETATGLTTLGQSLGIDNPTGSNDAASLAGSLYQIFREHAGALAWSAFWHLMPSEPEQHSATDAFANFAADAMAVTGQDYSFLFKPDTWTYAAGTSGDEIMTGTITGHTKLAMLGFGGNDRLLGTSGSDFLLGDTGDDLLRSGGVPMIWRVAVATTRFRVEQAQTTFPGAPAKIPCPGARAPTPLQEAPVPTSLLAEPTTVSPMTRPSTRQVSNSIVSEASTPGAIRSTCHSW
jgi:hypothetical protein